MKCNICGSEIAEGSAICSVCGSPAEPVRKNPARPVEDMAFNWNTFDFPKPKQPEDIEMSWPRFDVRHKIDAEQTDRQISAAIANRRPVTIMRDDAQEGFVATERKPVRQPAAEPVGFVQPVQQPVLAPQPVMVWTMPAQQPVPAAEPLWYTQPVQPQMVPVQYVPVYAQPAGPYTIAMQRADGNIPGMPETLRKEPSREAFPTGSDLKQEDDVPVDESWIKAQLEPVVRQKPAAGPAPEPKCEAQSVPEALTEAGSVAEPMPVTVPEPVIVPEDSVWPEPVTVPMPVTESASGSVTEPEIIAEPMYAAESAPAHAAEPEPVHEPEPAPVSVHEPVPSGKERFYTFNKKNEEFQALLDAEYARLKSLDVDDPLKVNAPEDDADAVIKVEDILASPAPDSLDSTRIWTEEDTVPVFNPAVMPTDLPEVRTEELSAFESMLMSGTRSRDEISDETIRINLSNVRSATVRPLADDIKIPDFEEPETPAVPVQPAPEKKVATAEEVASKISDEMRKAEELDRQQRSLRKQRLDEMAKAREQYFGPSLGPVEKPTTEVGVIGSRKAEEIKQEMAAMEEEALKAAAAEKNAVPEASETDRNDSEKKEAPEKTGKSAKTSAGKKNGEKRFDDYSDDDYRRGGSWFITLLIIIVVLVLLFEGAKLMAQRFIPENTVTLFLENLQTNVVQALTDFWNTVVNGFNVLFKQ